MKTLNEYLFDQLDRLSTANAENIDLEMNKAHSIVQVSEKILDTARLKLQIIQTNEALLDTFSEIDSMKQQVLLEDEEKEPPELVDEETEALLQRAAWNRDHKSLQEDDSGGYLTEEKKQAADKVRKKNQNCL